MTGRVLQFSFNAPDEMLNANQRLHWSRRYFLARSWRQAAQMHARKAMGRSPVRFEHAYIDIEIFFPDNRRRDVGNWQPTAKPIVDGCVDAGVLVDDDDKHLTGPDLHRGDRSTSELPHIVVTITETPGGTP